MKKSLLAVVAVIALVAVVSVVVVRSSDDGSRRQGALEESEAVSLAWRGDWSPEVKYARGSVVSHEGAAYVADAAEAASSEPKPGAAPGAGWAPLASEAASVPAPVLTSPNGSFKIEVTDTGILLSGPHASIRVTADGLVLNAGKDAQLQVGGNLNVSVSSNIAANAGGTLGIESGGSGFIKSSVLSLGCATGVKPVARKTDAVTGSAILGGSTIVGAC